MNRWLISQPPALSAYCITAQTMKQTAAQNTTAMTIITAYEQLKQLEEWGFGATKASIIILAIDRLYEQERKRRTTADKQSRSN